jgi:hypothetical protein
MLDYGDMDDQIVPHGWPTKITTTPEASSQADKATPQEN